MTMLVLLRYLGVFVLLVLPLIVTAESPPTINWATSAAPSILKPQEFRIVNDGTVIAALNLATGAWTLNPALEATARQSWAIMLRAWPLVRDEFCVQRLSDVH